MATLAADLSSGNLDGAVIVAMAVVRMMQVPGDQIVDVLSVRHRLVSASGTVRVARLVSAAVVARGAAGGVGVIDRDQVLVDVVLVGMVQMAVVEVVDMALVPDRDVPAVGPMLVVMSLVNLVGFHRSSVLAPFGLR